MLTVSLRCPRGLRETPFALSCAVACRPEPDWAKGGGDGVRQVILELLAYFRFLKSRLRRRLRHEHDFGGQAPLIHPLPRSGTLFSRGTASPL